MATKWTLEQEEIILEEVKNSPEHLRNAFHNASLKIERSTESICNHYYNKMMTFEKIQRGGKREGAGRKAKEYPVKQMGCRVPAAIFDICVNFCVKETKKFEKSLRNQK